MKYVSIIVTYNRKELLIKAVQSLFAQTQRPNKIILVDNHSTDGTEQLLEDQGLLTDDLIRYVRLPKNVGGSGGFHVGVKIALEYHVDWISLSDDDAIFKPEYFANISKATKKYTKVMAFSGTIKLTDGVIQYDQRNRISDWNKFSAFPVSKNEYNNDFKIDLFTFCGCVINVDLIKKIGLPRDDFFIWYDDIEYSIRIRRYSEIVNVPSSVIVHHTKINRSDAAYSCDWREYYGVRNRTYTIRELGKRRLWVNVWTVLFFPLMVMRILSKPMYHGNRKHVLYVNFAGFRDGLLRKMGKNNKFMP